MNQSEKYIVDAVKNRRVTGGYYDKLMALFPLKHKRAFEIMEEMEANNWGSKEVPLGKAVRQYRDGTLTPGEKFAFDCALAFVSNLDGIQFHNLADNIAVHITSPEFRMALSRQTWEESLHVKVYATMIEQLVDDPADIYTLFLRDDILKAKNEHILKQSALLGEGEGFTDEKFGLAIVSNMLLEGVYFYNAFMVFYALARMNKMMEPAENISLINRDELCHLKLFTAMHDYHKEENPHIYTPAFYEQARQLIINAVELETNWGMHMISGGGVLGLSPAVMTNNPRVRGDAVAMLLGMEPIWGEKSLAPWFDQYANMNNNKRNFFETKVVDYQSGGLSFGDEDE